MEIALVLLQENNPGKNEIPGAAIADVQLQLYSTTKDHPHVHGKMFFMNPKLSDKSNDSHTIVYKPCQENGATKNKVSACLQQCLPYSL